MTAPIDVIQKIREKLDTFPSSHRTHYCHDNFNQAVSILMPVIECLLHQRDKEKFGNDIYETINDSFVRHPDGITKDNQELLKILEGE